MENTSTLPRKRGWKAEIATGVSACLFFIIGACFMRQLNIYNLFASIILLPFTIMSEEIIFRMCLINEEFEHVNSRYDNKLDIFKHAFEFPKLSIVVFVMCSASLMSMCANYGAIQLDLGYGLYFFIIAALLCIRLLKLKHGPLYQALSIGNLNGLDYGSAMAYSFFHGYLQIVLPNKGTEQKGIKELMKDFEAREGIKFSCDKLLVLIPLSLYCPPIIEERSPTVELAKSLEEIVLNRAGVNKRSYKSTAYKIRAPDGTKKYVCLEYATPLLTLFNIIQHRNEHANDYEVQRKELALQFYLTLQNIINRDPDCKDCCDFIFFDDKTKDGEFVDVGVVVLNYLKKNA